MERVLELFKKASELQFEQKRTEEAYIILHHILKTYPDFTHKNVVNQMIHALANEELDFRKINMDEIDEEDRPIFEEALGQIGVAAEKDGGFAAQKIYIASPFFNDAETEALGRAEEILKGRGFDVFSPREHETREGNVGDPVWSRQTFLNDKAGIDWCDILVMLYWGNYSDSGTAWECGYAYATGKPVIVVQLGESSNLMVHEGSYTNLYGVEELDQYDFEEMPKTGFTGTMF